MQLPHKQLASLLGLLRQNKVEEFEYEDEGYKIRLVFEGARRVLRPAPAPPPPPPPPPDGGQNDDR